LIADGVRFGWVLADTGYELSAPFPQKLTRRNAEHLPLYRRSQMLARHGVRIERSTLAHGSARRPPSWLRAPIICFEALHERR
jgi:SRSO17 transposase